MCENVKNSHNHVVGQRFPNKTKPRETFHRACVAQVCNIFEYDFKIWLFFYFSSICWWVFSALVQTTRTLRLRRNLVKLSLYRHFTNTLAFAVLASVVFMLWSIKFHKLEECLIGKSTWFSAKLVDSFWKSLHRYFNLDLPFFFKLALIERFG